MRLASRWTKRCEGPLATSSLSDLNTTMYEFTKRVFDVVVALVLLVILLPLLLPLVLILKLTDEGEVFYFQDRVGFQNRKFSIWKFATMLKDSPNMSGGEITLRNDPRITTAGKFLRLTKLNELPQLVNVLIGDMSFVGPRPLMPVSFEQYAPEVQERVYESRPGITGIGSVIFRKKRLNLPGGIGNQDKITRRKIKRIKKSKI